MLVTLAFAGSLGLERYDATRSLNKVKAESATRAAQIAAAKVAAVAVASERTDHTQCVQGNEFRARDLDTWQRVFALLNHPSPAERALLADIKTKDKLRNC